MAIIAEAQIPGLFLAFVPFFACEYVVNFIFTHFTFFSNFNSSIDSYATALADPSTVTGRIAVSFIIMGLYILWCAAVLLMPGTVEEVDEGLLDAHVEPEEEQEAFAQPVFWRRTHFLAIAMLLVVFELVLVGYSTVNTYNTYLFPSWFMMKWYHFFLEQARSLGASAYVASASCAHTLAADVRRACS
jgi:hypothetical protein